MFGAESQNRRGFLAAMMYASAALAVPGDLAEALDLRDLTRFVGCLLVSGPGEPSGLLCFGQRADLDNDVDLVDFASFQNNFAGRRGAVCGNEEVEFGEECDDGNSKPGDGCNNQCKIEHIANDSCEDAKIVGDGSTAFFNIGATTDGPVEPQCDFFGDLQVNSDLWFVYAATCDGTAVFSLCGSDYDTKLAVYDGTRCPPRNILDCSDDDCGASLGAVQSRLQIPVQLGRNHLVRLGGFLESQGHGFLNIGCEVQPCEIATHDCFQASPGGEAGCKDAECCRRTCELDAYCCDATWDANCAAEAHGVCEGHFLACTPDAGSCRVSHGTPGCDDASCCNAVCLRDPICCLTEWDATCVSEAEAACLLTCGAGAGACDSPHLTPGCSNEPCCAAVCVIDEFCCSTEWDLVCVDLAAQDCP